jgi:hypothetical protein
MEWATAQSIQAEQPRRSLSVRSAHALIALLDEALHHATPEERNRVACAQVFPSAW